MAMSSPLLSVVVSPGMVMAIWRCRLSPPMSSRRLMCRKPTYIACHIVVFVIARRQASIICSKSTERLCVNNTTLCTSATIALDHETHVTPRSQHPRKQIRTPSTSSTSSNQHIAGNGIHPLRAQLHPNLQKLPRDLSVLLLQLLPLFRR